MIQTHLSTQLGSIIGVVRQRFPAIRHFVSYPLCLFSDCLDAGQFKIENPKVSKMVEVDWSMEQELGAKPKLQKLARDRYDRDLRSNPGIYRWYIERLIN